MNGSEKSRRSLLQLFAQQNKLKLKFCHKTILLWILGHFKWVYGNPAAFLVGIWCTLAYHVDYTTE